ncbi:hypothetical protein B0H14DRAFT_2561346 [Mycena olivaceomarginata]|nr:hypothetical protein B0H14DRAFT_2561346 [Mycena olivaceomarginata]
MANMQSILMLELYSDNPRLEDILWSIVTLHDFRIIKGYGPSPCIDYIAKNYSHPSNPRLEVHMIAMLFKVQQQHLPNVEHLLSQAEKKFDLFNDSVVKCQFYSYVGDYFRSHENIPRARQFLCTALELAVSSKNIYQECDYKNNAQRSQKLARLEGNITMNHLGFGWKPWHIWTLGHTGIPSHFALRQGNFSTDYNVLSTMGETYYLKSEYSEAQEIYMQIKNGTSDQENSIPHAIAVLNLAEITIITGKNLDHIAQVLTGQKKIFGTAHKSDGIGPMIIGFGF